MVTLNEDGGDAQTVPASCHTCVHRRLRTMGCDAFTDEIPLPIMRGRHDHKTPYQGDHGIMYSAGRDPLADLLTMSDSDPSR
ncbi:MAG TPA: hypothetical protein VH539_15595 [Gemmatimonadaceae bacterium]